MKNEPERKRKSDKGTESQKKQQKISEKSGSKKAAQHDFYHGDRVAAYSCGGSFFCVKLSKIEKTKLDMDKIEVNEEFRRNPGKL